MAKTPSTKLFELVQSLTGSEKRYFKLYVNEHGKVNSKYMKLFAALEAMDTFDEVKLKKTVYKDEVIESRKYSELKGYLYDLILKCLQAYDEKRSIDYRLKGYLKSIHSLYRRSLFEDCLQLIQKAMKPAVKYEKFKTILELQDWKKQIFYARADIGSLDKALKEINDLENKSFLQLQNLLQYKEIFFKLLIHMRKNPSGKIADEISAPVDLINHPLMSHEDQALSHRALVTFHRIRTIYHFSRGAFVEFFKGSRQLIRIMESKPHFLKEDLAEYISALSNYAISSSLVKAYGRTLECLDKLKMLKPITIDDATKIHRQYYTLKFHMCIISGEFKEGVAALEEHLSEIDKFDKQLFERDSFLFQYFYIYFGTEDYEKALEYLNRWLNLPKRVERQDMWVTSRLVNLILHYEMGNMLLLESLIRSTYRFLSKNDNLSPYESRVLGFFRDSLKFQNKTQKREALLGLKSELTKDKYQKMRPRLFNVEAWFEAKIQNKKFSEIIKEQFQKEKSAFDPE
jgi:tetratricopeptide (TPR) repeat protein